MKTIWIILFSSLAAIVGCSKESSSKPSTYGATVSSDESTSSGPSETNTIPFIDVHSSEITNLNSTYEGKPLEDFYAKYGKSQNDIGSGIAIFTYTTKDGKVLGLGTGDFEKVLYVKIISDDRSAATPQ